jgi:hypothetical protein
MKIIFSQMPLCLAVGVTSVNKIMKKVLKRLRKMPETRSLEKGMISQSFLDWVELEDFMIINTRNKYYTAKGKYDPPHISSTPSMSSQSTDTQVVRVPENQGMPSPLPYCKYNILNQLDNSKDDATLLDMVFIPKQQNHLKNFMEGKVSTIANLFEESKVEDSNVNKIGVNKF